MRLQKLIFLEALFLGTISFLFFSCDNGRTSQGSGASISLVVQDSSNQVINSLDNNLTEAIVDDGFSPPVASRIYAYSNIAFYEAFRFVNPAMQSLAGKLNGLGPLPLPDTLLVLDYRVAAIQAFSSVARKLVYRHNMIEFKRDSLQAFCFKSYKDSVIFKNSISFGEKLAQAMLSYIGKDNYKETRNMPKYTVNYKPGNWIPTAPMYNEAIEPHFPKLRTLVMDSSSQFKPERPVPYSTDKNSAFYKQAMEVYKAVNGLNDSVQSVTRHWDCNPVPSTVVGHLTYVRRQLSPGGHWIWITGKVCEDKKLKLSESAEIHALVAISLMDAFISCWDEKFRSERIRPETYIKNVIDKNWRPFLETPQFPEYTSGHSVISASASVVLTHYFGDNIAFVDSAEVEFGLLPRHFTSFFQASDEAMFSRFYGGIHYKDACLAGKTQGRNVGEFVWKKLKGKPST